jgi:3-phosphoshikimate 1-carboxyvinyltransferase (EC 2.5.1.19)
VEGKASFEKNPTFETYEDHRMAMAFAPFAMFSEISFEEPSLSQNRTHILGRLEDLRFRNTLN